jgi:hypothetical protein
MGQASATALSQLREIVADSQQSIPATAHLVYIEEENHSLPLISDPNHYTTPFEPTIHEINKHMRSRMDVILNYDTKEAKRIETDLRDVDALIKEYNLPPEQKVNVSQSGISLIKGNYELFVLDSDVFDAPRYLFLHEHPPQAVFRFEKFKVLGVINEKLLSDDYNPVLTAVDSDGKTLLQIKVSTKQYPNVKGSIVFDPSLGYRFRRIQWHSNGQLISETIADKYRDVNGVPFPFLYIERIFDKDGKIHRETKHTFEDVQLGVNLSTEDFKIFAPEGARLQDVVVSMTTHEIEQDRFMSIDDALAIGMNWVAEHAR